MVAAVVLGLLMLVDVVFGFGWMALLGCGLFGDFGVGLFCACLFGLLCYCFVVWRCCLGGIAFAVR